MWKKVMLVYFETVPRHLSGGTEEKCKKSNVTVDVQADIARQALGIRSRSDNHYTGVSVYEQL
jgi:hypothetical protein